MPKTAIVTGAASGIGLETCRSLLEAGWTVIGLDLAEAQLAAARDLFATQGDRFASQACDVRSEAAIQAAFAAAGRQHGTINALIACAGVLRTGPLAEMSSADFDLIFSVNLRGCWLSAKTALPLLRQAAAAGEPARIVFLSSLAALRPKVGGGAYAASKAALSQLTRVLAVECAGSGVLINAVAPATVDTPMVRNASDQATAGTYRPSGVSPIGRIAEPADIVAVIRFLLSDDSRYVTGTTIPVDGGTGAAFVPPGALD